MPAFRPRVLLTLAVGFTVLQATPAVAERTSGVQVTRDGKHTLISKDVGAERWAITLNGDDGSITGNVFHRDGGSPQFVWCEEVGATADDVQFACKGADACAGRSCAADEWTALQTVTIPRSFLSPPVADDDFAASDARADVAVRAAEAEAPTVGPAGGEPASGLQTTPDGGHRTLVSKDVGAERWAITRHAADRTVTGNVFADATAPPTFLWCDEKPGAAAGMLTLSCWAAPPCTAAPCTPDQWTFVAEVPIPLEFLGLASCADVSGGWRYAEEGRTHCTSRYADVDDTFRFGGEGNATITQSGCTVAIEVTAQGASWTMQGTVTEEAISVSGPASVLVDDGSGLAIPPGVDLGGTWRWDGAPDARAFALESSGSITARYAGRTILTCSVEGTHELRR